MTVDWQTYVVVATSRDSGAALDFVRSLQQCILPEHFGGLVLAENGAKSDLEKRLESDVNCRFPVRYLYHPVQSKSLALNAALRLIPADEALIFFSDDDIGLGRDILRRYEIAGARYGPGYFFGGAVQRSSRSALPPRWMVPLLPLSVLGWAPLETSARMLFLGCNWAAFKSDLAAAGEFDPRFGPGSATGATGQESDMQTRFIERGLKAVYVADAVVEHHVDEQSLRLRWLLRRRFRGGVYAGLRNAPPGIGNGRSYDPATPCRVLDPAPALGWPDLLRYRIARALCALSKRAGQARGARLRAPSSG